MVNGRYLERFPETAALMTPGRPFEEILRALARYGTSDIVEADVETWIAERLRQHRDPAGMVEERPFGHDGWLLVARRKTPDGGTVAVYTAVTDLKRRKEELEEARSGAQAAPAADRRGGVGGTRG